MGNMMVLWLVLVMSIVNLVLLSVNLHLLRRGYSQARVRVLVLADGELQGQQAAMHRSAIVASDGGLLYPDGGNGYIRRLQALGLERGSEVDVYVVPRASTL